MKELLFFVLAIIATSCASTPPPFYPRGEFQDQRLDEHIHYISFKGEEIKDVNNAIYVKSSEIALQHGFRYFVVLKNLQLKESKTLNFIEIESKHTFIHIIKFFHSPVKGYENFDAERIYFDHKKKISEKI